ncbi:MAG: hypothetical protein NT010_10115 [Proteobacteria bacterium]|nr:hypothetical protein [Pseudomonadota bacterium]
MGNEEILLHFCLIHINVYVNQAWVVSGMAGMFQIRMGCNMSVILQMQMGCKLCRP